MTAATRRRRLARTTIDGETAEFASADDEKKFDQMDAADAARDSTGAVDVSQLMGLSEIKFPPKGA